VYLQLLLGAWMRHTQSGLAIPDFPLAFGKLIPEFTDYHVGIHFAHRMGAMLVTGMIAWTFVRMYSRHQHDRLLFRPALTLVILVFAQLSFGAFTIWTEKSPIITTVHVATGALILGTSFLLTLRAYSLVVREARWQ
jgi:cytochrome c oxidase assembly protein subunit 15